MFFVMAIHVANSAFQRKHQRWCYTGTGIITVFFIIMTMCCVHCRASAVWRGYPSQSAFNVLRALSRECSSEGVPQPICIFACARHAARFFRFACAVVCSHFFYLFLVGKEGSKKVRLPLVACTFFLLLSWSYVYRVPNVTTPT